MSGGPVSNRAVVYTLVVKFRSTSARCQRLYGERS